MIFDLDGTLVDSVPDLATALDALLVESGRARLGPAGTRPLVGDGATSLVRRAFAETGGEPEPAALPGLVARFRAHYRQHLVEATRPYPGVPEMLAELPRRNPGLGLAVLTNKPGDLARALLVGLNLAAPFFRIVGDGDGFARKPDPEAALALGAERGAVPARTLVVGDGVPDLRVAAAGGMGVVAVTWGYEARAVLAAHNPGYWVDTPSQLFDIMND